MVYSEAGVEPYEGKIAVVNVVLYRCKVKKASIADIVYEKGQFDGVKTDNFKVQPNAETIKAVKDALNGATAVEGAYAFVDLRHATPEWATDSAFITRIGNHWFYKCLDGSESYLRPRIDMTVDKTENSNNTI